MADVTEQFRGSGFKVFAGQIDADPKVEVWAIPAPTGGNRAFCDRMNAWAQERGPAGARLHLLPRRRRGGGPDRQEHRARAHRGDPRASLRSRTAMRFSSSAAGPHEFASIRRRRPATASAASSASSTRTSSPSAGSSTSRCIEWNEEEKKIDFSHNPFSMPHYEHDAFLALDRERPRHDPRHQGDSVRHRLQRRRAVVGRDPQPQARDHEARPSQIAGYGEDVLEAEVRRHVARVAIWRAAPWRHRARASTASSCCSAARRTCAR